MIQEAFRKKKPKQYNVKPRYYDKEKEYEKMKQKEREGDYKEYEDYRRERLRDEWRTNTRERKKDKSIKRLIALMILALFAVILMFALAKF